jgi:hypothetical protein
MADVLQTLAVMAVGAGSAVVADQALPQIRTPIPGTNLAVQPGAWIGAGILAALALTGRRGEGSNGSSKNLNLRTGAAALGGGMLVWEAGQILENNVVPMIPGLPGYVPPAPPGPPPVVAPYMVSGGYRAGALPGRVGCAPSDYQVQAALRGF